MTDIKQTNDDDNLLSIENIRSKFDSIFVQNATEFLTMGAPNQNSPMKRVLQLGNHVALLVIIFFRQIEHFDNLHVNDRLLLIKCNLSQLFPTLKYARYQLKTDPFPFHTHEQRFIASGGSNEIDDQPATAHHLNPISHETIQSLPAGSVLIPA